jgi:hypothetical protein
LEKGQWEDHEIDGKISYRRMQPTCSKFGTGRLQQRKGGVEEEGWGGHGPKTGRSAIQEKLVFKDAVN